MQSGAPRKACVPDPAKEVERGAVLRDRPRNDATRDAGQSDAVAREALHVEIVRVERAEIGHAIARDVDDAAPMRT